MLNRLLAGQEDDRSQLLTLIGLHSGVGCTDLLQHLVSRQKTKPRFLQIYPADNTAYTIAGCDQIVVSQLPAAWSEDDTNQLADLNLLTGSETSTGNNVSLSQIVSKQAGRVLIDSLTDLLAYFPACQVARWLHKLKQSQQHTYAIVHLDCVEERIINELQQLATTFLEISNPANPAHNLPRSDKGGRTSVYPKLCTIAHRKSGGKLSRSRELFWLDSGSIRIEEYKPESGKPVVTEDEDQDEVINSLTTFNLGLKGTEAEARRNLVLPFYTEEQKAGQVKLQPTAARPQPDATTATSGHIYYEPDSGDDWDDEDPDDDLDI